MSQLSPKKGELTQLDSLSKSGHSIAVGLIKRQVKCDGRYPQCISCAAKGLECIYPRDARRSAIRNKKVDVRALEKQVEELKKQVQVQGTPRRSSTGVTGNGDVSSLGFGEDPQCNALLSASGGASPSRAPTHAPSETTPRPSRATDPTASDDVHSSFNSEGSHVQKPVEQDEHEQSPDPLTPEGRIQVYGATSLLHDQSSRTHLANQFHHQREHQQPAMEIMKAHLISNAALRRQEELRLIYTPSIGANIDFDGVPMDLAVHLLNLHWNRSHFSYLLTYRPAIMDSLLNNGPYVNKLLLNALYLQSSLYNDRSLPPDFQRTNNQGLIFYERLKLLLPEYLDAPTLPTVVALLIAGACLVPYGKQSAGWALCGMAYQMIIDLGCHLTFSPCGGESAGTTSMIEQEMKKRIYWGAFVSDKFQSLFLGRPPMMHEHTGNIDSDFLDSFEEMEEWRPYYDPMSGPIEDTVPSYYCGVPSHAISTFQSLLRLCKIATEIINTFYSTNSAKTPESTLLQVRDSVLEQLDQWYQTLHPWLRFDPTTGSIPAPHQMTPQ